MNNTLPDGPVLVTGATGTIGWHIASQLAGTSHDVRVLVRDRARAGEILPSGVTLVQGDLSDPASLPPALDGIQTVFHAAGLPEQWLADPTVFDKVNAEGTRALATAALRAGVTSFVHTSTIDVLAKTPGTPFDESSLETRPLGTAYQRSKQKADNIVVELIEAGLPARFTHPSALFGTSPSHSPGMNDLLVDLAANKLPALPPGGMPVVYAPDVARGHIAAAPHPWARATSSATATYPCPILPQWSAKSCPRPGSPG